MTQWKYARDVEEKLGWKPGTCWKKLYRTRCKIAAGIKLTEDDIPLPDEDVKGAPRWLETTVERYATAYKRKNWRRMGLSEPPPETPAPVQPTRQPYPPRSFRSDRSQGR